MLPTLTSLPSGVLSLSLSIILLGSCVSSAQLSSKCPDIFILDDSRSESTTGRMGTIGAALEVLGYTNIAQSRLENESGTFAELALGQEDIFASCPRSKSIQALSFGESIVPAKEAAGGELRRREVVGGIYSGEILQEQNRTSLERRIATSMQRDDLLRLAIPTTSQMVGHRWEGWSQICEYLGLGYSVMERLRLKGLPGQSQYIVV
ncbi:hypothetical protein BP6252_02373 [Coleophoma cylindrospora]|uniref:Uncharacterized protein n=1 Tax=Coleophoma cylindrospora TaxID=1849047 RepID=A0A3D8SER4_9HELO|nr:hypothetical protein BP6252_02373 [Coleophoma cylindrospora]